VRPSKQKKPANCACGWSGEVRGDTYNANVKRNGVYTCHHCCTIKAGKAGKFSHTPEKRSAQSKALWSRPEFRAKITATSTAANTTDEYRAAQSTRTSELWKDDGYKKRVSAGVTEALLSLEARARISAGLHQRYLEDPNYRLAVGEAARKRFADDEYRMRMAVIRANQPSISGLQIALYSFLGDLGVSYEREGPATAIGHYVFDCLVKRPNDRKLLIECQGNYWHSLPGAAARDRAKFTYINRYFPDHEIMYIWEHEFGTKDRVLDRLKLKLGIAIPTVTFSFKEIEVAEADSKEVRSFLDQYHYIGGSRGGRAIVARHQQQVIGCVLFSRLIRQNHQALPADAIELSRLCIHPSYHKHNFASWLVSRAIKMSGYRSIVAFADTTVGHLGTVYKAANFKLHHTTQSDYWYVDKDGYVMHKKTLYNRAVNLKLTEAEFADKYGYIKKWGGPKLCFLHQKS